MNLQAKVVQINPMHAIQNLCAEFLENKAEADRLTARNREIANQLEKQAEFKDGSNTGRLCAPGYKATFTRRVTTKWDQDELESVVRPLLTDDIFRLVFRYRFEPHSKKTLDAFLENASPGFRTAILKAMTTTPGQVGLKVETEEG